MSGDLLVALALFFGSAVLVIISGVGIARYGDALAGLMGWGRLWVGTILVAAATSLPELATNITAATRDQSDLAAGAILGSNMANMFILAAVALLFGAAHFFRRVALEQRYIVLSAMALTGLALFLGAFHMDLSFLEIGLASVLILIIYLVGMRVVYITRPAEVAGVLQRSGLPGLRRSWMLFGLSSLGVLVAAPALAFSVEEIAETSGISTGFLGVAALAIVTSMPEITTTVAALRIGAADLAVGNLYGSCAFNILILALADPFYRKGILVETLGDEHLAAGLLAIGLMGMGLFLILSRGRYRYIPVKPSLAIMALLYLAGLYIVFSLG